MRKVFLAIAALGIFVFVSNCIAPVATNPQALAQENACVQSLQLGDYQGAKTRCELCLEYNEKVPECVNGLGLVAYANNDTDTAIKYFTQAIQMSSNFAQARNNLGAIYFKQSNFAEALPFFKASVNIDPGYQDARYNLALSYLRVGQKEMLTQNSKKAKSDFSLAQDQYRKLMAVNSTYANAYRDMGLIMTYLASMETDQGKLQSDLNKANDYFKQCLQVDSNNEGCRESYGHTLLYQNQFDMALYQFVQCLSIDKTNVVCIQGMADAYQGSQMKSGALSTYMQMLKANPNDAQGHLGYCIALFQNGMNDMAASECQTASQLNAKLCDAYFQLAMYYKKTLNSNNALSNCRSYILCDQSQKNTDQTAQCQRVITTLSGQ